jgi:hypothetical protein
VGQERLFFEKTGWGLFLCVIEVIRIDPPVFWGFLGWIFCHLFSELVIMFGIIPLTHPMITDPRPPSAGADFFFGRRGTPSGARSL